MKTWVAVLSVLGGLFGLGSGFFVTTAGTIFGEGQMANDGASVFWLSALAIILGFTAWKWNKASGIGLIVISVVGFYMNGLFFIVSFLFLLIAGILALKIKKKPELEVISNK